MAQVKRKSLPEESITVDGGPMPQLDPRTMTPVPPQIQMAQQPMANEAMLLEKVKQLRGGMQAPQPDVARPSQVMYPMNRAAGMQADQLEQQAIGPKPDRFAGMTGLKRMLAQGLLGAAEGSIHAQDPGGYSGWRQRQDQIEQQATNSQLDQVRALRAEQLQRERMYQDELQTQQTREQQQYQFGVEQNYRDEDLKLKKAQELRMSQPKPPEPPDPFTLGPGQQRFDPSGKMLASVPERPPAPDNSLTDTELFMRDPAAYERMLAAQAKYKPQTGGTDEVEPTGYRAERGQRIVDSVDELTAMIDKHKAVGVGTGLLARIPFFGQGAANFRAKLETLKSNITTKELQEMRADSKTGGALGNVSNQELGVLNNALGALDTIQDPTQYKAELKKIKDSIVRWQRAAGLPEGGSPGGTPAPTNTDLKGLSTDELFRRLMQ